MKVLFINTIFGRGSTGRIVADLGDALEKDGNEYAVAFGRGPVTDDRHGIRIGGRLSICAHAALARLTDGAGLYSVVATKKLIGFIRNYNPDIIHLHNLHGYYLNTGLLFRYLKEEFRGRVVYTLHDCWAFTGHCVHFTCAGCEKWKDACGGCKQKGEYPASFTDCSARNLRMKKEMMSGLPDMRIVTVSRWLKQTTEQSFLGAYPVTCIYNGVDTGLFRPVQSDIRQRLGIDNKKMVLLVSDGWTEQKGFPALQKIAGAASDAWVFVVVGVTKKQISRLPRNIIGYERIWDREELIRLYSAADIFLNPSLEETFGLVTAEAMSCGTPAIVLNSTACPELITNEKAGAVLPADATPRDFSEAMEKQYDGTAARESVMQHFSKELFLRNTMEFYRNGEHEHQ